MDGPGAIRVRSRRGHSVTEVISSRRNPRVVAAASLEDAKQRRVTGRTLVEGPHIIAEALAAGFELPAIYVRADDPSMRDLPVPPATEIVRVTADVLRKLAPTAHPRGPIAELVIPRERGLRPVDTVVLWEVADPGNVGTLIRTAASFGFDVAVAGGADPWSPKAIRSAAGGHFRTSVAVIEPVLDGFGDVGLVTVALVVEGGAEPATALATEEPVALILGSEAQGLPGDVVAAAERTVTFGLEAGMESLNVAAAGAIAIYERRRLRPRAL